MNRFVWLHPDPESPFPPVEQAMIEPDGLLAVGGDLHPHRIINAYRHGIFPWYSEGEPILWWSPDPRCVFFPEQVHISRSLRRAINKQAIEIRFDTAFEQVIDACAEPRPDQNGTWITAEMRTAYIQLHRLGYGHCIECWQEDRLVGGLYGLAIGKVFFGESMFSRVTNASKIALVKLCEKLVELDFRLMDAQVQSEHLMTMGAQCIAREDFVKLLEQYCQPPDRTVFNPAA